MIEALLLNRLVVSVGDYVFSGRRSTALDALGFECSHEEVFQDVFHVGQECFSFIFEEFPMRCERLNLLVEDHFPDFPDPQGNIMIFGREESFVESLNLPESVRPEGTGCPPEEGIVNFYEDSLERVSKVVQIRAPDFLEGKQ